MCTPIVHAAYWEYNIAPLLPEKLARVQLLVADIFTSFLCFLFMK